MRNAKLSFLDWSTFLNYILILISINVDKHCESSNRNKEKQANAAKVPASPITQNFASKNVSYKME